MEYSLLYFSAAGDSETPEKYRLVLEAARFADRNGFTAVWIPERHFHPFGGLYPNPAVVAAAVASQTTRVGIRAGSVVLPLHHVIRVAEEWSIVDNLSGGRVGVSFASGWQRDDFVLAPDRYEDRRTMLADAVEQVRSLWRGKAVPFELGDGTTKQVRIFPRPLQPELPVWITSAGSPGTAELAGRLGAGLLTHLLGQSFDELAQLIDRYRAASMATTGTAGQVALMLHTFLRRDAEEAVRAATPPLKEYLRSATTLRVGARAGMDVPFEQLNEDDWEVMLRHAARRYLSGGALVGDMAVCQEVVERAAAAGVNEIACLVDFVTDVDQVMEGLPLLDELRGRTAHLSVSGSG